MFLLRQSFNIAIGKSRKKEANENFCATYFQTLYAILGGLCWKKITSNPSNLKQNLPSSTLRKLRIVEQTGIIASGSSTELNLNHIINVYVCILWNVRE